MPHLLASSQQISIIMYTVEQSFHINEESEAWTETLPKVAGLSQRPPHLKKGKHLKSALHTHQIGKSKSL